MYISKEYTNTTNSQRNNIKKGMILLNKADSEKTQQKKKLEKFNSVTNKVKVENQNQEHNVVEEGIGPINQKR